jgi:hypothetical protein
MVYQEQVMQIVHELGDIPLRSAYTLIKAISKKKEKVINAERPKFIEGASQGPLRSRRPRNCSTSSSSSPATASTSPLDRLRDRRLPDRVPEDLLPRPVHGRRAHLRSQAQKVDDWLPYLDDCARMDRSRGEPQLIVSRVLTLDEAPRFLAGAVQLTFQGDNGGQEAAIQRMTDVVQLLRSTSAGADGKPVEVIVQIIAEGSRVFLRPANLRVVPDPALIAELRDAAGPDAVRLVANGGRMIAPRGAGIGAR